MTTTTQVREWWAPACDVNFLRYELYGEGVVSIERAIKEPVDALNAMFKRHSYETRRADTGAYNCRQITGGTKYSLHAYGIAIDVNWSTNPYGPVLVTDMPPAMIRDIEAIKTKKNGKQVWRWGGRYSGNKDAMHFEIIVSPDDLEDGVVVPSAPKPEPAPTPEPQPTEDDMPKPMLCRFGKKGTNIIYVGADKVVRHVPTEHLDGYKIIQNLDGVSPDVCVLAGRNPDGTWHSDDENIIALTEAIVSMPFIEPFPSNWASWWEGPVIEDTRPG